MTQRAALIGLGMVADMHAAALASLSPNVVLHGVHARRVEQAGAFAARHGAGLVRYASVEEIAADPDVDFAIVTTPPDARLEMVRTLAGAGKPILIEKPIERDAARAEEIVRICEDAGVPLGVVLQHRMREAAKVLQSRVDAGVLGRIATVELRVPWWRDQSYYDAPGRGTYSRDGGGVLITQAIHTIDLMLQLAGRVSAVQAVTAKAALHDMEAEDFAAAGLVFENGAVGTMMASTTHFPGGTEEIILNGTEASARISADNLTISWRDGRTEEIGGATGTGGGADPMAFTHAWHAAVISEFAKAIETGREPMITGRSALEVQRLIGAIERSAKTGIRTEVERTPNG